MKFLYTIILIISLFGLINSLAIAASWQEDDNRGQKGWYGYEPEPPPQEEKEPEPEPIQPVAPVPAAPKEITNWPSYEDAMKMRPEELAKFVEEAAAQAFQNPEDEEMMLNWTKYMAATRVKSSQFAQSHAWVTSQHPEYVYQQATDITPGTRSIGARKLKEKKQYLKSHIDAFGIILFTAKEVPLNSQFETMLNTFKLHYEWDYKIIDVRENPKLTEIVGVSQVPQVYLVAIDDSFSPVRIATGLVTSSHLAEMVYRVLKIKLEGRSIKDFADQTPSVFDIKEIK